MGSDLTSHEGDPKPRRGRPPGDHDRRRAELLDAATSIIAADGYAACSLRSVAKVAGCTTGTVTYYFRNKAELIAALAEQRFEQYRFLLEPSDDRSGVRQMLARWLEMTATNPEQWPVSSQLVAAARLEPTVAAVLNTLYRRFRSDLAVIIRDGQARGTVRSDISAETLADAASAMGDGWAMLAPVEPDYFTPERVDELLDAVDRLLSVPART